MTAAAVNPSDCPSTVPDPSTWAMMRARLLAGALPAIAAQKPATQRSRSVGLAYRRLVKGRRTLASRRLVGAYVTLEVVRTRHFCDSLCAGSNHRLGACPMQRRLRRRLEGRRPPQKFGPFAKSWKK